MRIKPLRVLYLYHPVNFGIITQSPCLNVLPPVDSRCSDPAYRLQHPELCPIEPSLIIKPGIALVCQLGSIQFKAFLIQNGEEVDVTSDSTFTSSDLGIAWVGVKSGNATGVGGGIATITATYQGKHASAEFNVMGCTGGKCDATVAMLLLVDTSKSMSQVFSGSQTKLGYAKVAAGEFASTINVIKDLVGAMTFNAAGSTLLDAPTADAAGVAADIAGIAQTQQLTTFHDAFVAAISELDATTADLKVLILFSDGEDTTAAYDENNNPLTPIDDFKAAGGIVMCLGTRAHGPGFNFLEAVATGGFFLNAYASTAETAIAYLNGLRGYICAGNCTPAGDEIEYKGRSNWDGWINWDVLQGVVDVLGNGFYDALPGNGLYMDLIGSSPGISVIRSKNSFPLSSGHVYRVSLDLAGNQIVDRTDTVTLRVLAGAVVVLTQTISLSDYSQPSHTYAFSFAAPSDMDVKIEISQSNDAGTDLSGVLLMRVRFEDTTDIILLLDDDFDTENPTYIPPRCGMGSVFYSGHYAYGYNCYGEGCLDSPPGIQLSDPSPLPNLESGFVPPTEYTSTKTVCASCPSGSSNIPDVSLIPVMTSNTAPSGVASSSDDFPGTAAWNAFDGYKTPGSGNPLVWTWQSNSPVCWLRYQFPAAATVKSYKIFSYGGNYEPKDWTFEGSNDGASWTVLDTQADIHWYPTEAKAFTLASPATYTYFRLNITANNGFDRAIVAELELYGPGEPSVCKTATATSEVSQAQADAAATAQALSDATAELHCVGVFTSTQSFTATCSYNLFPVTKSATAISLNSQAEADAKASAAAQVLAEAALDCNRSTNGQKTTINDNSVGSPYPSVQFISGGPASIAKVVVTLTKINHFFSTDIGVLLVSPSGTRLLLMANSGTAPLVNVTLVFDQAVGSALPSGTPITSGTWRPNAQPLVTDFPAPVDPRPPAYSTTLNDFIGENANGLWALFTLDDAPGSSGSIDSWNLTIT